MKPLLLLLLLGCTATAFAQTRGTARLYGYRQPVVRGAVPQTVQEESGAVRTVPQRSSDNYHLYISSPARILPQEVWINGTPYAVNYKPISKKPVVLSRQSVGVGVEDITLVPQTADGVWKLTPVPPIEEKLTTVGRRLSAAAALVVVYRQGGKLYYSTLKELEVLEAEAAM